MHSGEFIRKRREALGLEPEEIASRVGLNRASYYDLEACEDELTTCVSLAEIARLETVLNFDVRNVFSHWTESRNLTLQELADLINAHLQTAKQTLDEFENAVGWEVGPMLKNPALALDWNLDCLKDVCAGLVIPWESVNFESEVNTTP